MSKRFVDTELWQKEWYQDLSLKEKILVKYIFENCDCAGVWETNYRMASFIIGETITKSDIDAINNKKNLFSFIAENKLYIKGFIEFQYGKLSYNCKPHLPVIKLLQKYGIEFETIDEDNLTIKQQRKRLTSAAKEKIFIRDKYECQYCGSKEELEIDHIIPLSKGGNNDDSNLITACHKCNNLKSDKTLKEFVSSGHCKNLDRVSKILETLEEKEQEQDKEKDINLYGIYNNVTLSKDNYNKFLGICANRKLFDELIDAFSENIETGKEEPYRADFPNAHFVRLKAYYDYRRKYPDRFKEPEPKTSQAFNDFYEREKTRMKAEGYIVD